MPTSLEASNLVRKLDSTSRLTGEERDALLRLPMIVSDLRAKQDIVREGDRPSRSCLLIGLRNHLQADKRWQAPSHGVSHPGRHP